MPEPERESFLLETEQFLHDRIPLSRAMGVRVEAYDDEGLVLTAPLDANHNHLGTAFGGSLSAIATLAGYALLWLELGERDSHIVIRSSSISYRHPVEGKIRASCKRLEPAVLIAFKERFAKAGKARMSLNVSIGCGNRECVDFEGCYVAIR